MKLLKSLLIAISLFILISPTVFAKSSTVSVDFDENSVSIDLPDGYIYYTNTDIDKSTDYFNSMPIDKNDAIEKINNGTYIDAFSEKSGSQITLNITTDKFSQTIGNFTPMDDNDKQSVIKNFKSILNQNGQEYISEPKIIEIDGYDFIEFNCRVGSGENGFNYKNIISVIGGNCYEIVCFNKLNLPDEEVSDEFNDIIDSVDLDIKGETGEIVKSFLMSVITVIVIIFAVIVVLLMIYSLIKEFLSYRNHADKVQLKKRN